MANTPYFTKAEIEQKLKSVGVSGQPKSYYKIIGEDLYILSKFSSSLDIQFRFRKAMFNELYTFQRVAVLFNSDSAIDITKIDAEETDYTLARVGSDFIGPVSIPTYGFLGGNHSLDNDNTTKTADTNDFKIVVDGVEMVSDASGYCNEVLIEVDNTIFDPALLPSIESLISEKVTYTVVGKSIDVSVNHYFDKDVTINSYYGMQALNTSLYQNIYYGNSSNTDSIDYDRTNGTNSGDPETYPNVNKIVASNDAKSYCMALDLNKKVGLGAETDVNVTSPLAFTASTGKIYFRLIADKSFSAGESYYWNGCYTWFDQNYEIDKRPNTVFGYGNLHEGKNAFSLDFKDSETQYVVNEKSIGKSARIVDKNDTVNTDGYVSARGLKVIANGSGSIRIEL